MAKDEVDQCAENFRLFKKWLELELIIIIAVFKNISGVFWGFGFNK
jgi:hypothetical protein